jgi:N utilization substance protein B
MTTGEEREQAFILLFEKSFNNDVDCDRLIELAVESGVITKTSYTSKLFRLTSENIEEIDSFIEKYSKSWSVNRISKVSLALLRLAICEIRYIDKVPAGVTINEIVNLCKKYSSEDEYSFVNGILGSYVKDECK